MFASILIFLLGVFMLAISVLSFQCYNAQDRTKVKNKWNFSVGMIVLSCLCIIGPLIAIAASSKSAGGSNK